MGGVRGWASWVVGVGVTVAHPQLMLWLCDLDLRPGCLTATAHAYYLAGGVSTY